MLNPRAYGIFPEITKELELLVPHFDENGKCSEAAGRLYIRVSFSILEAQACVIRDKAMQGLLAEFQKTGQLQITTAAFLEDHSYRLTSTGKLERQGYCDLPFAAHFAFSIRTLAEVAKVNTNYIQGEGWDAFQRAVRIRNRITHPKCHEDIQITEEDMVVVHAGLAWAFNAIVDIFEQTSVFTSANEDKKDAAHR